MDIKMSLKKLLGLNGTDLTEEDIIKKISYAEKNNLDEVEFNIDGKITKIEIPHIGFDPDCDKDTW